MFNLILFFAYIGALFSFIFILKAFKKDVKEATRQQMIEVNDLPNWQPMSNLNKRSNKVLNQMYKGKGQNIC
jgi:hypothetical protein